MPVVSTDLVPIEHLAVDISSTDFDCTVFKIGYAREIYVGAGGDATVLKLTFLDGRTQSYENLPNGSYVSGFITKVVKSGTTTTKMIARS